MISKLKQMTAQLDADYFDIRYETKKVERVVMSKGEIRAYGSNLGDGYVLRVLKDGGFASVSFTKPEQAPAAVRKALENARVLAAHQSEPRRLAPAPAVKDTVKAVLEEDPRQVSLPDKLDLTRHYSDLLMQQPSVANVDIEYSDTWRDKYFLNSEGSEINEELVTTRLAGSIVTQDGSLTQTVRVSFGGSDGFQRVRGREADALEKARIAAGLLKAEPV
ncbi:MAG TPA: DNA gyrase modulator, partial [Candidatus Syntrophosphaera sp.]|nr:DNA gyrase modulator [Candidatus Syntrophosphaera sp.]